MRSIVKVTTPATNELLTTVERVQGDLGITGNEEQITTAIEEASSRIEAELGYHLALETVTETFRAGFNGYSEAATALVLERAPVVAIDEITIDARVLVDGEWIVDEVNGLLYWVDGSGLSTPWRFAASVAVSYSGGWIMPGDEDRTLPPALEAAAVAYCRSMLASRDQDPMLRSVEIPGVIRRDYHSPSRAGGESAMLPPDVASMLNPFKRIRV